MAVLRRARRLRQRLARRERLQVDGLPPARIEADDDPRLQGRVHPGHRVEGRLQRDLAVGAAGPVGGVGRRPVGQPLDDLDVVIDGAPDVGGHRHHVAVLHRQRDPRPLHRQRAPQDAGQRGQRDRHGERNLPPAGDRCAEERGAAADQQQGAAKGDGADGDRPRHARERIPGEAVGDQPGQPRQPAGQQHRRDEGARGVAEPRRPAAERDEQADAADHQDLGGGVVDPAVARHQVPEHEPRRGGDDRRRVDQRPDDGEEQHQQAGDAGPGLRGRATGWPRRRRRARGSRRSPAARPRQRQAGCAVQHQGAERHPEPGRGGGSRQEPRPGHRRPERPLSPHVCAMPRPVEPARRDFPALNGSALSRPFTQWPSSPDEPAGAPRSVAYTGARVRLVRP